MDLYKLAKSSGVKLFAFFFCMLAACAPVYETYESVPEGSIDCVADAKQIYSGCKASHAYLFDDCMTKKEALYQIELSNWYSEKALLQSKLDSCISKCLYGSHKKKGDRYKNDYKYCVSSKGPCDHIEYKVNSSYGKPYRPSKSECSYIYKPCDNEYTSNFKNCGGTYNTHCVKNCE